ncbi:MAG: DUF4954 family protein [Bacteroidales bacterium]|nr:DUF4954 family protein [Bacteroidales bacterium]
MNFRSLGNSEIAALQNQGCFSSEWSKISVSEKFSTDHIRNVRFLGEVKIGKLGGEIVTGEENKRVSGLFNCKIINCEIGDDVLIDNVHLIQNYRIRDRVIIENADTISVNGPSSFGNGFEVEALNEGGGRELLIFDKLSAQLAYILVCYRHDPVLIEAINRMIKEYARERTSETGNIGTGTQIVNSGSIYNVNIGEHASIRGASLLQNGTIVSNSHAPVLIGENVIARNFIVLSGSTIDGGALIDKCFVGQSVEIGKQFSSENSVFFANTEAFHGEAVSLFAGPYTVTHHKSSLLIAGMFSFFNAGSGTNQSNHMYKLGPVHQGIVERGSKTGSFTYMLWPSRIGAYSVVIGKNLTSFDTSDFPFSYINVDHERSILTPGMNLFTVGTRRDSEKWPRRDKRKDPQKSDLINFDFLSPYIIQKVAGSIKILNELYEKTPKKQESVLYKGIRIKRLMLKSTRKYYELALSIFIGNQIIRKLDQIEEINSVESIREGFSGSDTKVSDNWIDLAGMIAPGHVIQDLIRDIKSGSIKDLDEISAGLEHIHASYESYTWDWTTRLIYDLYEVDIKKIGTGQLIEMVTKWELDSIKLDKMILNDAAKEYDSSSKIGFGIDGDDAVVNQDFNAVRGNPEENKFIAGIKQEIDQIEEKAEKLKSILSGIS